MLRLSIRTRCLLGGYWPKFYGFQSALGGFRVASGLNITALVVYQGPYRPIIFDLFFDLPIVVKILSSFERFLMVKKKGQK